MISVEDPFEQDDFANWIAITKRVGDKVMASELDLAPGVVLRSRERDFAVAKIVGSRRGGASAGEEEEPAKVKVNEKKEKEKTSTLEKK